MFNIGDMVQDSDDCLGIVGINYLDGDFVTTEMDVAHLSPQLCKWDDDRRSLVERRNQPKKLTFDEFWREHRDWLVTIYNSEPDPNIAVMEIAEAGWRGARNAK